MFISVIPLGKSLSRFPSLYRVETPWDTQITRWWLVEIPLWTSLVDAIVYETNIDPDGDLDGKIRPIVRVISKHAFLDSASLSVITDLARLYYLPIHKIALMFMPRSLLNWLDTKNYLLPEWRKATEYYWNGSITIHHALKKNISIQHLEPFLKKNTLFVFPDTSLLDRFYQKLTPDQKSHITRITLGWTPKKKRDIWVDITTGKYDIIFWTRRILYYNLSHYQNIIYLEDAFIAEQFHYPIRIRSIDIIGSLVETGGKQVHILTSSPTFLTLSKFRGAKLISEP